MKKLDKIVIKIIDDEREKRSIELFNKPTCLLQLSEILTLDKYISDCNNPIWKPILINGKKSKYIINNIGDILSFKRSNENPKLIKSFLNSDGYPSVKLYTDDNVGITKRVHRIVAEVFISNPDNKPEVNHITGVKTCAWVGNLEWVTSAENSQHSFMTGLNKGRFGEENSNNVYTEKQIHQICKLLQDGKQAKEISDIMEIPKYVIDNVKMKNSWVHISKDYNIPETKSYKIKPPGTRQSVIKMFNEGNFDYTDILNKLNLDNTLQNRMYISNIKSELKRSNNKVESSTTIDHH